MISKIMKSTVAASLITTAAFSSGYDKTPPFGMDNLEAVKVDGKTAYQPKADYSMFLNYELGMHCVGFDMSYCCVIPPYNSIQSQAIKVGKGHDLPKLMTPEDNVKSFCLYQRQHIL